MDKFTLDELRIIRNYYSGGHGTQEDTILAAELVDKVQRLIDRY